MIFREDDYDTIIILDACRYDYYCRFRKAKKIEAASTQTIYSIRSMFPRKYSSTVYISGNPFINSRHVVFGGYDASEHFHLIDDVWLHGWENIDGIETVAPWNVLESTTKYQNRGLKTIVHFVQPHAPYIGKIKLRTKDFLWLRNSIILKRKNTARKIESNQVYEVDIELLRKAYHHNLSLVLNYAMKCVNGKTFITSDHGELLGENGLFHHGSIYKQLHHQKLLEIPLELLD